MRDGTDRLGVSKADHEPTIHELKDTAFGLHCGIGGLIEQAAHVPIAVRGSVAVIDARALIVSGTRAHPRREPLGGGKRGGRRAP
jgi:hypothetical protein